MFFFWRNIVCTIDDWTVEKTAANRKQENRAVEIKASTPRLSQQVPNYERGK